MLKNTLDKIEKAIAESGHLSKTHKQELEKLAAELRAELTELEKTKKSQAHHIAEQAEKIAASHAEQDDTQSTEALANLKNAVREFEASHPNLTRIINSICVAFEV